MIYIDFLRYCVDELQGVPKDMEKMDWQVLYSFASQQAIHGVIFDGVKRLKNENVEVPRKFFLKWVYLAEQIKKRNRILNQHCVELTEQLQKEEGFECCILKGQGNAVMYPNPYARTPGDIDIWTGLHSQSSFLRKKIVDYARQQYAGAEVRFYHVEYKWKGIPVELHFMPGIMNNPLYNRRLQKWYSERMEKQCSHYVVFPDAVGKVPAPTIEFNVVFQLAHMMHHFFDEGIGLRQMIDYFYLLRNAEDKLNGQMKNTLMHLNLYKFAGAVMWVLHKVLGLDEKYLIVPVDERRGKTLLREILKGGNFGQHSGLTKHKTGTKYFMKHWRNLHFVREYPSEALCEPIFRTWHFFWRMSHR